MELRGYQRRALAEVQAAFAEHHSVLITLPVGTGKTQVFATLACERPGRALILAHRRELVEQAAWRVREIGDAGATAAIDMGGFAPHVSRSGLFGDDKVVVSSVQKQIARRNGSRCWMERYHPADFGLVVIDEAHHAAARSYRRIIDYYSTNPDLRVLGVTATPDRHDRRGLGAVFERWVFRYECADAIEDGWLVPIQFRCQEIHGLDLSSVQVSRGDLHQAQLARVLEEQKVERAIAHAIHEIADGRRTLVFAVSVAQAQAIADLLNGWSPDSARMICAKTPIFQRQLWIDQYRRGVYPYLVNVGIATEGFDVPEIEVLAIARPTRSRALYMQMLGRGMRPLPGIVDSIADDEQHWLEADERGDTTPASVRRRLIAESAKPHVEVIEFTGNYGKHSIVTPIDVLSGDYTRAEIERAKQIVRRSARSTSPETALQQARTELAKEVRVKSIRSEKVYAMFDLLRVPVPVERGWRKGMPATERQRALLQRFGAWQEGLTIRQASALIDACIADRRQGRATLRQRKLLARMRCPTNVSFAQASALIEGIKANGWRPLRHDQVRAVLAEYAEKE